MTSSSLLGIDSTRCRRYSQSSIFWHHSFRISRFSSSRLVQGASLSCLFIQDQTFSIGLRSGLFPGHLMRVMLGLASLVGGIFKTGETRKIGLAYILRNGEFSCDRTVKFRPDLIRDHSSIPKKFGVPISKGLGAVHCQRPANFFCADCISPQLKSLQQASNSI